MFTLTSEICPKKKTDSKILHLEIVICNLCVWLACVWFCSVLEWIFQDSQQDEVCSAQSDLQDIPLGRKLAVTDDGLDSTVWKY